MNVLENNRLILEFMGLEFEETMNGDKVVCIYEVEEREQFFEEKDLRYHSSWDWLMTVSKKIDTHLFEEKELKGYMDDCLYSHDLETRYQAIIEFINHSKNC